MVYSNMKKLSLISLIFSLLFVFSCEDKVEKDTTPPELTIVSPSSGSTVGEIVQIKVQTTDESGILKVDFYIQNSIVLSDTTLPYEYEWNTTTNQDGEYKVKVVSFDTEENFVESEVSVTVDNNSMRPTPVNIDTIYYTTQHFYVKWTKSSDSDFKSYQLYYSTSSNGERSVISNYENQEKSSYWTENFDPTIENWYFLEVTDIFGLSSLGQGKSNVVNLPPQKVNFDNIEYNIRNRGLDFYWKNGNENDFLRYVGLMSNNEDMSNHDTVITINHPPMSYIEEGEHQYSLLNVDPDQKLFFRLDSEDIWDQTTQSDIYEFYEPIMFSKEINDGVGSSVKSVMMYKQTQHSGGGISTYSNYGYVVIGSNGNDIDGGDGLHLVFGLDGEEKSLLDNRIGDGLGGGGPRMGLDVVIDDLSYVITGFLGEKGQDSKIFISKENPQGFSTFHQLGVGQGNSISKTTDGGFLIVGSIWTTNGRDIIIIKTDNNLSEVFRKQIGDDENDQRGLSGFETTDGGYIVSGTIGNQLYVVKTNSLGEELWSITNSGGLTRGHSITKTTDGGYLVVGEKNLGFSGGGGYHVYFLKILSNGDIEWEKTSSESGTGFSVIESTDGSFVVTGVMDSNVFLMKTDLNGNNIWTKKYDFGNHDVGYSVDQYGKGGYIITGTSYSTPSKVLLIKTDLDGNSE